jgi:hypothetical protein
MKTKKKRTRSTTLPGGTFKLADDLIVTRMGYGAMQLAGPHVFGPPAESLQKRASYGSGSSLSSSARDV